MNVGRTFIFTVGGVLFCMLVFSLNINAEASESLQGKDSIGTVTILNDTIGAIKVKNGPGHHYENRSEVIPGDIMSFYGEENGWIKIKNGWIEKKHVIILSQKPTPEERRKQEEETRRKLKAEEEKRNQTPLKVRYSKTGFAKLHEHPSKTALQSGSVNTGDTVFIIDKTKEWFQVRTNEDNIGWIKEEHVTFDLNEDVLPPRQKSQPFDELKEIFQKQAQDDDGTDNLSLLDRGKQLTKKLFGLEPESQSTDEHVESAKEDEEEDLEEEDPFSLKSLLAPGEELPSTTTQNGAILIPLSDIETGVPDGEYLSDDTALGALLEASTKTEDIEDVVEGKVRTRKDAAHISEVIKPSVISSVAKEGQDGEEVSTKKVTEIIHEHLEKEKDDKKSKQLENVDVALKKPNKFDQLLEFLFGAKEEPIVKGEEDFKKPLIEISIKDYSTYTDTKLKPSEYTFVAGSINLELTPKRILTPGLYTATITMWNPITQEEETITQNFLWGVLAVNTDQDTYPIDSQGTIDIAVLDDLGTPVCDADVTIEIHTPLGDIDLLTIEEDIEVKSQCKRYDAGNVIPDYTTTYTFDEEGVYTLKTTALIENGVRSLNSYIEVFNPTPEDEEELEEEARDADLSDEEESSDSETKEENEESESPTSTLTDNELIETLEPETDEEKSEEERGTDSEEMSSDSKEEDIDSYLEDAMIETMEAERPSVDIPTFTVKRISATRNYPSGETPMTIDVTFLKETSGVIIERVPGTFEIDNVSPEATIHQNDTEQIIVWSGVEGVEGETQTFSYTFNAPDISPQFYSIGPLLLTTESQENTTTIEEKRIWMVANDDPGRCYGNTTGLVSCWTFEDGAGTTAGDTEGTSDGTLNNFNFDANSNWSTDVPAPISGFSTMSIHLDGANDYINTGDLPAYHTPIVTVAAWVKLESTGGIGRMIIQEGQSGGQGWFLFHSPGNGFYFCVRIPTGTFCTSFGVANVGAGTWTHIVASYEPGVALKLYQDGALVYNNLFNGVISYGTGGIHMGAENQIVGGLASYLDGYLDDVRIYDRALSDDEVANLANGTFATPGGVSTNLNLWLKADAGTSTTSDGSVFSDWEDQSIQGNDGTQSTGAQQPIYQDGSTENFNYNPVVEFDGSADNLELPTGILSAAGDYHIYYVARSNDLTARGTVFYGGTSGANNGLSLGAENGPALFDDWSSNQAEINPGQALTPKPYLFSTIYDGTSGRSLFENGLSGATDASTARNTTDSGWRIGEDSGSGSDYWDGYIGEVVVYDGTIPAGTEQNQIESYLATKWGLTLDQTGAQDYTASDGATKIWNSGAADAATHNNDIAGVGRDEGSGLGQVQSKSVNSDAIVEIVVEGEGTNLSPSFVNIDDMEFLSWGNNDGAESWTSTGAPTGYEILDRQWSVQENNGDVGTVQIDVDVANTDYNVPALVQGTDYYFIYDTDNDGDLSDETPSIMTDQGSDIWQITGINFDGGQEFTLAQVEPATPGGISANLNLWLKADAGTSTTTDGSTFNSWLDQSGQSNDGSQGTGSELPVYQDGTNENSNYNPVVEFDGANDNVELPAGIVSSGGDYNIYYVGRSNDLSSRGTIFFGGASSANNGLSIGTETGPALFDDWSSNQGEINPGQALTTQPHLFSSLYDSTSDRTLYENGLLGATVASTARNTTDTGWRIGEDSAAAGNYWNGYIGEVIVYDGTVHNGTEQNQVESYLAYKWGLTLDQGTATDYTASDGATEMWDKDTADAGTYNNDIAGIGRDDKSGLSQIQSKSVNDDAIVEITAEGEGSNLSPSFTDITDFEFLSWGNNDGAATWTTTGAPAGYEILSRQWSAQEVGDVGTIQFDIDVSDTDFDVPDFLAGTTYYLVIDSDNDGDLSDETPAALTDQGSDIWQLTGQSILSGAEFTIASLESIPSPGGVGAFLTLWTKADGDVYSNNACFLPGTAGGNIACWGDHSGNSNHLLQATASDQPTLVAADGTFNYNPSLNFLGSGDSMEEALLMDATDDGTVYAITNRDSDPTASGVLVEFNGKQPTMENTSTLLYMNQTGSTPAGFVHGTAVTNNITYINGMNWLNGTDQTAELRLNGLSTAEANFDVTTVGTSVEIASNSSGGESFTGDFAEVAIYDSQLSAAKLNRVESYFALKYGITLDQTTAQDYTASDETTEMWDKDTADAATFNNDIAGIGRDDDAELGQVQSKSVNTDGVLEITAESEGSNATNSFVDIANLEFMTWGNNNGAASWTDTGAPTGYRILERQWSVQENNGDVGTVQIDVDVADTDFNIPDFIDGTTYFFVYDSDNDGDLSDETPTAMADQGSNIWRSTGINVDDQEEFTLATTVPTTAPGGVLTNLEFWLKADARVYENSGTDDAEDGDQVESWKDSGFVGLRVAQTTASLKPTFNDENSTNAINYNPTVTGDGVDDFLRDSTYASSSADMTLFTTFSAPTGQALRDSIIASTNLSTDNNAFQFSVSPSVTTDLTFNFVDNSGAGGQLTFASPYDAQPHLYTVLEDTDIQTPIVDGLSGTTFATTFNPTFVDLKIFQNRTNNGGSDEYMNANAGEFAYYTAALTAVERQRVHSYLAIKWGITLDQSTATDYLASDGVTEMWDKDTGDAATFNNDIAGIGQDDDSALGQVKSKSVNTDAIVTIEAENEGTNTTNAFVDISNLEFLSWGNDDGAASWTNTGSPNNFLILTRQWSVQENSDVGTVQIDVDVSDTEFNVPDLLGGTDYYFVYDSDNDGDLSDESATAMTDQGSDVWRITGIDFTSGQEFTIATEDPLIAPGGVIPNLQMWNKADGDSYTDTGCSAAASAGNVIACWGDHSTATHEPTQSTNALRPQLTASSAEFNYNPSVTFFGNADYMFEPGVLGSGDDGSVFTVIRRDADPTTAAPIVYFGSGRPGMHTTPTDFVLTSTASTPTSFNHATGVTNDVTYLSAMNWANGTDQTAELRLNGESTTDATMDINSVSGTANIGGDSGTDSFDGEIAEVVVYNEQLSAGDRNQVESYLALKYGITLDQTTAQDYTASDGTTEIWDKDATNASTHNNDIAGVGYDYAAGLGQVQSKSVNTDAVIEIQAEGEGTNALNTFSDMGILEFFTWGNNDGGANWTSSGAPSGFRILSRQWLAHETNGDVGTLQIDVDVADADFDIPAFLLGTVYYLVYDTDGDGFLSDETPSPMADKGGDIWRITGVNMDDNALFSIATVGTLVAPGAVTSDMAIWLKADDGVSATTNGQTVSTWLDKSGNSRDMSADNTPSLTIDSINYNPSVFFDNTQFDRHVMDAPDLSVQDTTMFVVGEPTDTFGDVWTIGVQDNGGAEPNDTIMVQNGNVVGYMDDSTPTYHLSTLTWAIGESSLFRGEYSNAANFNMDVSKLGGTVESLANVNNNAQGTHDYYNILGGWEGDCCLESFGYIAETVVYDTSSMTAANINRVESYLALKYGLTLDQTTAQDYTASDGATEMWDKDAADASTYNNDIAGIGRDDDGGLGQVQSKSENDDAIIEMTADTEGTNAINSFIDIDDKEFLTWGNNDGAATWTTTSAPTGYNLLTRQWSVQENNGDTSFMIIDIDVADTDFDVPTLISGTDYYFVYDSDNDGDLSDETPLAMTDQGSDIWRITGIDFDSGEEFTLATEVFTADAVLSVTTNGDETGPVDAVFTVTLSKTNDTGAAITFDTALADILATGASGTSGDYDTDDDGTATISVPNGATTGTITIDVTDDALFEADETFSLTISNPSESGVTIITPTDTATITDNDTANASITVTTSGDEAGPTAAVFTVTLDVTNNTGSAITLDTTLVDITATGGSGVTGDYDTDDDGVATVSIADGASTGTITIDITDDAFFEGDETYSLTISNPSDTDVTITTASATDTITDNETINASIAVTTSADETGPVDAIFTVTLDVANNTGSAITFDTTLADITATGASGATGDYDTDDDGTATVTIANGATTGTITIDVTDDALFESDETFSLTISNPSNTSVTITTATATDTITDNDTANASIAVTTSADENGPIDAIFTVTLDTTNNTGAAITFDSLLADITATGASGTGGDYDTDDDGAATVSIADGATTGTITIDITDDLLYELAETFSLTISNPSDTDVTITTASATDTITDNDTPTASIAVTTSGAESGPVDTIFTVTLSATNNTGSAITFDTTLADITATGGSGVTGDYDTDDDGVATVTIADGASTGTITIDITDDAAAEGNETYSLTISNPSDASVTIATATATDTITDDEIITADVSTTTNGDETGPVDIVFTVTLTSVNTTGSAITFDTALTGTTATAGSDFTDSGGAGTISVANGATTGTLTVPVTDDAILESTETLSITISNPSSAVIVLGTATSSATITDNDTATASVSTTTNGNEAGPIDAVFTVTLSTTNGTGSAITFDTTLSDVSATGASGTGGDYDTDDDGVATVSIADGASTGTITIDITDDATIESVETFALTISNQSNASVTIATAAATASITDNDVVATVEEDDDDDEDDVELKRPKNLTVICARTTAFLTWTDKSTDENTYEIDRTGGGESWETIAKLSKDTEEYTDTGLTPGRTYQWKVRVTEGNDESKYSDTVSCTTTGTVSAPQSVITVSSCSDGIDNDNDGTTDYPDDLGCQSAIDNDESDTPSCADSIDNDLDGQVDFPDDKGCDSQRDTDESGEPKTACADGIDNDGDGTIDFPNDTGCSDATDDNESISIDQTNRTLPTLFTSPEECTPVPLNVWIVSLLVIVGLIILLTMIFHDKIAILQLTLLLVAIGGIVFWFFTDTCRDAIWVALASGAAGALAMIITFFYHLNKKK